MKINSFLRVCMSLFLPLLLLPGLAFGQTGNEFEKAMTAELANLSNLGDSAEGEDVAAIRASNRKIGDLISEKKIRGELLKVDLSDLDGMLWVATSSDGNLRAFSWDNQMGGSMRYFNTVFAFRDKAGNVQIVTESADEENGATPFYDQITEVNTPSGTTYVLSYTEVASSTLTIQGLRAVEIGKDGLNGVDVFKTPDGLSDGIEVQFDFSSAPESAESPFAIFEFGKSGDCFRQRVVDYSEDSALGGKVTDKYVFSVLENGRFVQKKEAMCRVN